MDIVRLAIVYETSQAEARLRRLDGQLNTTHTSTRKMGQAAIGLAQSLASGNVSATALTSRLSTLGGKAGAAGVAIAVVAGTLLLLKRHLDANREAAEKFADQLRTVTRSVNDLFRTQPKTGFQQQIEQIGDALLDIDRKLARQRLNLLERWFGGASLKEILAAGKRFVVGGEDPTLRGQRGALGGQLGRLTAPGAELQAARERQSSQRGLDTGTMQLLGVTQAERLQTRLKATQKDLEELVALGLDPLSEEAIATAQGIRQLEDQLRRAQRAEQVLTGGLQTMADALEDFVVTGTLAFTDFLNNILRMLYRDFTGELIHGIVQGAVRPAPGSTGGTGGGIEVLGNPGGPGGPAGSVTSQVNFQIQTLDARGVAQFLQANGAQIAAEVTRHAGRSSAMRRKLMRG